MKETNTCDKCKRTVWSQSLNWITAEDFQPLKGETLPDDIGKYDALCGECYESELLTPAS